MGEQGLQRKTPIVYKLLGAVALASLLVAILSFIVSLLFELRNLSIVIAISTGLLVFCIFVMTVVSYFHRSQFSLRSLMLVVIASAACVTMILSKSPYWPVIGVLGLCIVSTFVVLSADELKDD